MARRSSAKRAMKFVFYGAAVLVGTLLAIAAVKRKGDVIRKKGKKFLKKAKHVIRSSTDRLTKRQREILKLFDREEKVTNEMIGSVIKGVTERTIRRDLTSLEEKGYIQKVGKTKGSHYVVS